MRGRLQSTVVKQVLHQERGEKPSVVLPQVPSLIYPIFDKMAVYGAVEDVQNLIRYIRNEELVAVDVELPRWLVRRFGGHSSLSHWVHLPRDLIYFIFARLCHEESSFNLSSCVVSSLDWSFSRWLEKLWQRSSISLRSRESNLSSSMWSNLSQ